MSSKISDHDKEMIQAGIVADSDEPILEDDYPIYCSYWYVVDGRPMRSDIQGTVRDLKRSRRAAEVRRCAAVRRGLMH